MIVEVIGKKIGSFTDKVTGDVIEYGKLHCIAPFEDSENGVSGSQCLILSVRPNVISHLSVFPCHCDLQFNRFGKVAGCEVLSAPEVFE